MENLISHISNYTQLTAAEIQKLTEYATLQTFDKGDTIFSEGKISDEIYFVTHGCVRLFYNVEGNDKTAFFYTEGQFICAGESYTFNIPAVENYQAVEPTTLFIFTKTNIEKLLAFSSKFEILARIATENELITCQKMIASFVTQSAEERYLNLLEHKGDLFLRVPQQYIAGGISGNIE